MALIVGNSPFLIEIINSIEDEVKVIPWRKLSYLEPKNIFSMEEKPLRIYLVGFDFNCFSTSFKKCIEVNVLSPAKTVASIKRHAPSAEIIYVCTRFTARRFTTSRYLYAKQNLGYLLSKNPDSYTLELNSFLDYQGKPVLNGGWLTHLAARTAIKILGVEISSAGQIREALIGYRKLGANPKKVYGLCLWVRRNNFVDRMMRLLIA